MNISKKFLKIGQTKLLDCKDIYKYTTIYQFAYNQIYSFIIKKSDRNTKSVDILLQVIILINMGTKYVKIISTKELK